MNSLEEKNQSRMGFITSQYRHLRVKLHIWPISVRDLEDRIGLFWLPHL